MSLSKNEEETEAMKKKGNEGESETKGENESNNGSSQREKESNNGSSQQSSNIVPSVKENEFLTEELLKVLEEGNLSEVKKKVSR